MKTSELVGAQLDWAVATALGYEVEMWHTYVYLGMPNERIVSKGVSIGERDEFGQTGYEPSEDWGEGGPILESEKITLDYDFDGQGLSLWTARKYAFDGTLLVAEFGPLPLIAAMRCLVAFTIGDEVEIPEELQ